MYIMTTDKILLPSVKCGVMPVDSPTVPNALVTSNRISRNEMPGSMIPIMYVPVIITLMPIIVITAAFLNVSFGIA